MMKEMGKKKGGKGAAGHAQKNSVTDIKMPGHIFSSIRLFDHQGLDIHFKKKVNGFVLSTSEIHAL